MPHPARPVVTGLGVVSPLGTGVGTVWERLVAGRSGLRRLPPEEVEGLPVETGGAVPSPAEDAEAGYDPDRAAPERERRKMDRYIGYALHAAEEAVTQAGWRPADAGARARTATVIGTGIGGFDALSQSILTIERRGIRKLSPFTVPSFLPNMAAGWLTMRHGFRGPLGAPATACAAGAQAIADAARLLRAGEADAALCGGAEAALVRQSLGGFVAARALAPGYGDEPHAASRPFEADRTGFVMGEGAGILVIETLAHARARGAVPLAEIAGYGLSADAHHVTSAPPDGAGAQAAMRAALADAGMAPEEIDHVNAHATATPVGDLAEIRALQAVFGDARPAISATKSATGHLLGASGGLEAVFSVMALASGVLPPTLNLDRPDPAAEGLDIVGPEARRQPVRTVMSNAFGFGGVNVSLIFRAL